MNNSSLTNLKMQMKWTKSLKDTSAKTHTGRYKPNKNADIY